VFRSLGQPKLPERIRNLLKYVSRANELVHVQEGPPTFEFGLSEKTISEWTFFDFSLLLV
jgi:hypothetical protein